MQPPKESLDDFINIDTALKRTEAPRSRSLQATGEVEVLRPLARSAELERFQAATGRRIIIRPEALPARKRLSWYHRSLAFSGVVATGALILGIVAGIYAPAEPNGVHADLAADSQPLETLAEQEPERATYLSAEVDPSRPFYRVSAKRPAEKRRPVRIRHNRPAYRSRQNAPVPPSRLIVSEFVPTTLVIYVENGEVRTRVEQHPTGVHRKKV